MRLCGLCDLRFDMNSAKRESHVRIALLNILSFLYIFFRFLYILRTEFRGHILKSGKAEIREAACRHISGLHNSQVGGRSRPRYHRINNLADPQTKSNSARCWSDEPRYLLAGW
jgi:hypothetical protein